MKASLLTQRDNYLAIIYRDVLEHKPITEIHNNLIKATVNPNKALLSYVLRLSNRAKRFDKGKSMDTDILAIAILQMFQVSAIQYGSTVLINSQVRKHESEGKSETLINVWEENRQTRKIFYVASRHGDCAEDHKDYQGKIYVDRYWHNYDTDGKIAQYVRANNIRTVQWVVGEPVWFLTRPNCRHYFTSYTPEQILGGKYHVPRRKIGNRKLQTPKGARLNYYEQRLKTLIGLRRVHTTDLITRQINKTKVLITKLRGAK